MNDRDKKETGNDREDHRTNGGGKEEKKKKEHARPTGK